MNLIGWDETGFAIPRRGWPGRRRAIVLTVIRLVAAAALFVGLLALAVTYIWLLAPAGAAYPR